MARQERAEHTRRSLIEAAASKFAAHGYAGTSLLEIVTAAGVTMGALTFHFATKSAVADAVQKAGTAATRAVMRGDSAASAGLRGVLDDALALATALETTATVRAAARLTREGRATASDWYSAWVPQLREGVVRGWPAGRADSGLTAHSTAALLTYALAGFEATASTAGALRDDAAGGGALGTREELVRALEALSALAAPAKPPLPGASSVPVAGN
jgi:AcrR family transcriptional regulator